MLSKAVIDTATSEVQAALDKGILYSPEEAWASAGKSEFQTLWSIAISVALRMDASAEELCAHLEKTFPHGGLHRNWLDARLRIKDINTP